MIDSTIFYPRLCLAPLPSTWPGRTPQYTLTAKPRLENPIKAGRGGGRARLSQPTPPGFPCCKPSPGVRVCQGAPGRRHPTRRGAWPVRGIWALFRPVSRLLESVPRAPAAAGERTAAEASISRGGPRYRSSPDTLRERSGDVKVNTVVRALPRNVV
ncbi:hypothetical protein NDU88_003531 [Pleurodeles waltl]|uniref:Uncharacterized protein n=1 Tax=Pleurodeles waltl TaxID=8319 RepID=A0AAV7UYQ6_PLEWA|nr:hypothetical protein NDU88_003531 [Pleurodeles waltl]